MILQSTLSNLWNFIDNIMVGQMGTIAIESVSIVNQIFFVYICVVCDATSGAVVFSTQFFVKKDHESVKKIFQIKWIFTTLIIFITIVVFLLFISTLVDLYLHQCDYVKRMDVLKTVGIYLPFIVLYAIPFWLKKIYANTLNESGNTTITMYSAVIAS